MSGPGLFRILLLSCLSAAAKAQLVVNAPEPLTHVVQVQPIIVRTTGGVVAEFMGAAASEIYIKDQIDRAWAQVGVDIEWLPAASYTNDFAYNGAPSNYASSTRPQSHLGTIVDSAGFPPKNSNGLVLNIFFVEIVPGFTQLNDNYANGLAFLDANGIAVHTGRNLVTWPGGRDVVASVIAHEIGHNLGLNHYSPSNDNLMYSGSGSADRLVQSQKDTIYLDKSWTLDSYDYLQPISQPSNYDLWAAGFGLGGGPDDDDDLDRLSNGFEFLFGSAPDAPTAFPGPVSTPSGPTWTLPKNPDAVADGFDYEIQTSPSLGGWLPAGAPGSGSTVVADNTSQVSVRLNAGAPSAFLRVGIASPPAAGAAAFVPAATEPGERTISGCGAGGCGHRHRVKPVSGG